MTQHGKSRWTQAKGLYRVIPTGGSQQKPGLALLLFLGWLFPGAEGGHRVGPPPGKSSPALRGSPWHKGGQSGGLAGVLGLCVTHSRSGAQGAFHTLTFSASVESDETFAK